MIGKLSVVLFLGALISANGGLTAFADRAEDRHSCNMLCLWVSFGLGAGLLRKMLAVSMDIQCRASCSASRLWRSVSIPSSDLRETFGLSL